jgi:hypothetical protein
MTVPAATIMGGEPLLNPTIVEWVNGLNRIFKIDVQILTNGTRFRYVDGLYKSMLYRSPINGAQNHIGVSLHNHSDFDEIRTDILNFLEGPIRETTKEQSGLWGYDWGFVDKNNVMVNVWISNNFSKAAIQENALGKFTLHNSDPIKANSNCAFQQWKSYHFIRGKLYKCGPVALMPEFDQQFMLDISDEDRALLNSYRPLTVDNYAEYNEEFFANLDKPLSQCKFCPENYEMEMIYPIRKGRIPN